MVGNGLRFVACVSLVALASACSGPSLPAPECNTPQYASPVPADALGCEESVAAAMTALRGHSGRIVRIQFGLGGYCAPGDYCPILPPGVGTVTFTFANDPFDYWVGVSRGVDGKVHADGAPVKRPRPAPTRPYVTSPNPA